MGKLKKVYPVIPALLLGAAMVMFLLFPAKKSSEELQDSSYKLYYVNSEQTKVISMPYDSDQTETVALAEEFIEALEKGSEATDHMPLLGEEVRFQSYKIEGEQLTLNLAQSYQDLDPVEEILIRASLVRTFAQLPQIRFVTLTLDGEPLKDSLGLPVGAMEEDSFIENAGNEINAYEKAELKLYFTDVTGATLHAANRMIVYNSNISLERLAAEQVILGPTLQEQSPVINPETKVLNATVRDNICYLNLDDGFLVQMGNVLPEVKIYALVNTLVELPAVSRVQISVNGETDVTIGETISLDTVFERNLELTAN